MSGVWKGLAPHPKIWYLHCIVRPHLQPKSGDSAGEIWVQRGLAKMLPEYPLLCRCPELSCTSASTLSPRSWKPSGKLKLRGVE